MARLVVILWPISVLINILFVGQIFGHPTSDTDLENKLREIELQVTMIDNKVSNLVDNEDSDTVVDRIGNRLKNINSNIDLLSHKGSESTRVEPKEAIETITATKAKVAKSEPFKLISVTRRAINDETNQFVVRFLNSSEKTIFRVYDGRVPDTIADNFVTEDGGVLASTFLVGNTTEEGSPWVVISDLKYNHILALNLNNTLGSDSSYQQFENLPRVHVEPDVDVAYKEKEDLRFKMYVEGRGPCVEREGPDSSATVLTNYITAVDLQTMKFENFFDRPGFSNSTSEKSSNETRSAEELITLDTGSYPISGYFQVSYDCDVIPEGPITMLQISRSIIIRPEGQLGPFPKGYLAFEDEAYEDKSKHGNAMVLCEPGTHCMGHCAVVGDNVTRLDVFKVKDTGALENVTEIAREPPLLDYNTLYWNVTVTEDSGDEDGIITFACKAYNSDNKTATKLVDAVVLIEGTIDGNKSGISIQTYQNDTSMKLMTFTCAISGRPLPDVKFSSGSSPYLHFSESTPQNVRINANGTEAAASFTYTITKTDLRQLRQSVKSGRLSRKPYCTIWSKRNYRSTRHELDIPVKN